MDNKPKTMDKGAIIASYEPVVDIVARSEEFSGEQPIQSILENLQGLNEDQRTALQKLHQEFWNLFSTCDADVGHCNATQHKINTGVKTDPEKIKAVVDWPRPETVHKLRSFLGLCSYYRLFVRNFSTIARPLHKLTVAKSNFNWTKDCQKSFNSLKQALAT
ncbi:retrovirus-related Pol polyprotein from transposon 297 [Nephila pilipes]|uniref:RNA-directed DNA polymerase n=1 Tax=Nephila pilipes TaxID=299642 RepID=A0A8X6QY80_NEPPI|nr:retrovirus-related Pol polyprotein from transposon 297 [Nephila pilipes]